MPKKTYTKEFKTDAVNLTSSHSYRVKNALTALRSSLRIQF